MLLSRRIGALTLATLVFAAANARAQEAAPPPAATGPTVAASETAPAEREEEKERPMNGYSFGLQLGMARVSSGTVKNPAYSEALVQVSQGFTEAQLAEAGITGAGCSALDRRCRTDARFGLRLSLPVQIGGEGVGFRLEPMFTFADSAKAYGLYTGPTFNFHVKQGLYLGFGFGLMAAWVKADGWKYAGDVYGRVPLTATYYVIDDLALVLEVAYGGGVSIFADEPRALRVPGSTQQLPASTPEATFGVGRTWDLTLGVRFP